MRLHSYLVNLLNAMYEAAAIVGEYTYDRATWDRTIRGLTDERIITEIAEFGSLWAFVDTTIPAAYLRRGDVVLSPIDGDPEGVVTGRRLRHRSESASGEVEVMVAFDDGEAAPQIGRWELPILRIAE
ncbi:hypothetical protein [Frankia sp. AgB32]|uniref:hypothetical protein n=1 Tax=Frankia sp. AgB32 TaxID=631119 RepID=UPI00200C5590|nr:hypothetical protein [Frankia sp. AgB32]MCK9898127.1 hypothetical protein [Frankia sp. AgB32]